MSLVLFSASWPVLPSDLYTRWAVAVVNPTRLVLGPWSSAGLAAATRGRGKGFPTFAKWRTQSILRFDSWCRGKFTRTCAPHLGPYSQPPTSQKSSKRQAAGAILMDEEQVFCKVNGFSFSIQQYPQILCVMTTIIYHFWERSVPLSWVPQETLKMAMDAISVPGTQKSLGFWSCEPWHHWL